MLKIKFISIIFDFKIIFGIYSNYFGQHLFGHLKCIFSIWKRSHQNRRRHRMPHVSFQRALCLWGSWPDAWPRSLSSGLKQNFGASVLFGLLNNNPEHRLRVSDLLQHKWLRCFSILHGDGLKKERIHHATLNSMQQRDAENMDENKRVVVQDNEEDVPVHRKSATADCRCGNGRCQMRERARKGVNRPSEGRESQDRSW